MHLASPEVSGNWKKIIIIDIYRCLEWQYILCAFSFQKGQKANRVPLNIILPLKPKFTKKIYVKSVSF